MSFINSIEKYISETVTDYKEGDKVKVTEKSFKVIEDGNHSIKVHPGNTYLGKIKEYIDKTGIVTRRFTPGYEMNVTFEDGKIFHMKDNWVEKA